MRCSPPPVSLPPPAFASGEPLRGLYRPAPVSRGVAGGIWARVQPCARASGWHSRPRRRPAAGLRWLHSAGLFAALLTPSCCLCVRCAALGPLCCAVQIVTDDAAASEVLEADEFDAATQDRCGEGAAAGGGKTRCTGRPLDSCLQVVAGRPVRQASCSTLKIGGGLRAAVLSGQRASPAAAPQPPGAAEGWLCMPAVLQHPLRSRRCEPGSGRCGLPGADFLTWTVVH